MRCESRIEYSYEDRRCSREAVARATYVSQEVHGPEDVETAVCRQHLEKLKDIGYSSLRIEEIDR